MYKYIFAVLCLVAATSAVLPISLPAANLVAINRRSVRSINPFGIVEDVEYCGGNGQQVELRITDCTSQPCMMEPEKIYSYDFDFIPYRSGNRLDLQVWVILQGVPHLIIDHIFDDIEVIGEEMYTLSYNLQVDRQMAGETFRIRAEIGGEQGHLELCGIVLLHVLDLFK